MAGFRFWIWSDHWISYKSVIIELHFVDQLKAFLSITYNILLNKLLSMELADSSWRWFRLYLWENWSCCYRLNTAPSKWRLSIHPSVGAYCVCFSWFFFGGKSNCWLHCVHVAPLCLPQLIRVDPGGQTVMIGICIMCLVLEKQSSCVVVSDNYSNEYSVVSASALVVLWSTNNMDINIKLTVN